MKKHKKPATEQNAIKITDDRIQKLKDNYKKALELVKRAEAGPGGKTKAKRAKPRPNGQ